VDVRSAQGAVGAAVTVRINQFEFDALVSFTFNLGGGNLRESTLLKKLNQGDYAGASDEFPRWDMAGGQHLAGLRARREKEQILFRGESWRFTSELGFAPYY
jgi:lysozyme